MPFTPFHFGPGLLLKAATPRHVSFVAFAATHVAIDVETLVHILHGDAVLHRELHTFVGATLAGLGVAALFMGFLSLAGRGSFASRILDRIRRGSFASEIEPRPVLLGALLGGVTHPFFDGLMHRDIRPFLPASGANPLLGAVDVQTLHMACVACGLLGFIGVVMRAATVSAES